MQNEKHIFHITDSFAYFISITNYVCSSPFSHVGVTIRVGIGTVLRHILEFCNRVGSIVETYFSANSFSLLKVKYNN